MSIQSTLLTTTADTVYTSTGSTVVTTIYVSNYTTSANATFSLFAVGSGYSASNTNKLYSNVTVTAGDTYVIDSERLLLDDGDVIQANANVDSRLTLTVSYTTI
jgi:hypothetical protein